MKIASRNNFISILLLLFLLTPALFLMLRNPIYPSQDGLFHVERIRQFHQSVTFGKIPPRLAPGLYDGIGYPLFTVNYQLPYWWAEFFMLFFGNPYVAFKSVMAISYILSAVFAFFLFKNIGGNLASFAGAILFAYLPYRFANLYTRGAFGEAVAYMFVPLVMIGIHRTVLGKKLGITVLALSVFGLVTSHTSFLIMFGPFFALYTLLLLKPNKRAIVRLGIGALWGLALSSFQLLPSLFEKRYLNLDANLSRFYDAHFISWRQLTRVGGEGVNIGTPIQLGAAGILTIAAGLLLVAERKFKMLTFFAVVILVALLGTQPISLFVWEHSPVTPYLVYPWRLLSVVTFSVAMLAVYVAEKTKYGRIFAVVIILFSIFSARHYFLTPTQYASGVPTPSTTTAGENDTIWTTARTFETRPTVSGEGDFKILNLKEEGPDLSFTVDVSEPSTLIVRRMYFPGWKVAVNGREVDTTPADGLISLALGVGRWDVETTFGESRIRLISDLLTLVFASAVIASLLSVGRKSR
ncbi:MAG: 6-pyruvoyl-tetrahydropterin synthase-related protein [Candidatus Curtissbacteria bacterium]